MLYSIFGTLAVIYLVIVLIAYFAQRNIVFFPTHDVYTDPSSAGLAYQKLEFTSGDGNTVHGWYVPHDSARFTLLFCHGNAGNIANRVESLAQFHRLGLAVLIFDYRGYGKSPGTPSEDGLYADARAAYAYLAGQLGTSPQDIILFGRSLGGAVAVQLAAEKPCAALIVESTFTRMADIASYHYPYLPVRLLLRYDFNAVGTIKELTMPKLFVHSSDDDIVPYKFGRALFSAAPEPKQFLDIRGLHNDGFLQQADIYESGIRAFLDSLDGNDG
jgi:fermentation-respiration switch protein FrsA (DUF1100 family)